MRFPPCFPMRFFLTASIADAIELRCPSYPNAGEQTNQRGRNSVSRSANIRVRSEGADRRNWLESRTKRRIRELKFFPAAAIGGRSSRERRPNASIFVTNVHGSRH